ncbi:methionyl-tRNA formyltransferase [Oscillatoria sp. FACHB-1406]|uniref:methionyl-tRNA formyltransferase n=1 Tax=Oscillatoria sp. FACHB-1406 TaxID=2692846 RepID=UPI0016832F5A|nr:methionyl-tRNA formyltransferase [Oscillatoria sp. FACHB-1406]MBD2578104.1 methionyl-tRNA formyltransferase [Oscillatoria sp. FACHB-1406]
MKVVFFGTPQFAVPCLERLLETPEIEVVAVVTQPDKPRGRGKQLIPSPVKEVAIAHNLPVWQPKRIKKSAKTIEKLRQAAADYFVVVAYGQILSQEILDLPRGGCINNHGSILPEYRGAAPIQWSIYNGETETGITTMLMDAGMDTGAMLLKATTAIALLENSQQLAERLASIGADLLIETLFKFDRGEVEPIPQDNARATYAPLIQKSDFNLDWTRSAIALHNQVRAFSPNCVARWREQPLKILATVPIGENYLSLLPSEYESLQQRAKELSPASAQPGEVVGLIKKFGAIVQTGDGLLLLKEVQLAGKRPQHGWDFVNGMRLKIGEVCEGLNV